ncbi:uncharacterized protein LOC142239569 [Haematobia irritans]|uniref:uncharacterized protein LOC142239569 n=1 Tax=Haematobia irritans TaxID=7368 RepID=UPI003F4F4D64
MLGFNSGNPFYINEQLSQHNFKVFREARRYKNEKRLHSVYTMRGVVYNKTKIIFIFEVIIMSNINNYTIPFIGALADMVKVLVKQRVGLHVCHINAQSLKNKIDEFRWTFEHSQVDVICLSETWFNTSITNAFVSVKGYKLYRADRKSHGGGVAIYVKDGINAKVISCTGETDQIEHIFLDISTKECNIFMGTVYRPNSMIKTDTFMNKLESAALSYNDIILVGDFNANILYDMSLVDNMNSIGLSPTNYQLPTHFTSTSSTLLDLFFVNDQTKILLYDQLSAPCFSKHDLIFITYNVQVNSPKSQYTYRDFKNINYEKLENEIFKIEWDYIYTMASVDDQAFFLENNIEKLYESTVKLKTKTIKNCNSPWFSDRIKQLIIDRDLAYQRWKRFKLDDMKEHFRSKRKKVNEEIKKAKTAYYQNRFYNAVSAKKTWRTIREIELDFLATCSKITSNSVGSYPNSWKHSKIIPIPKPNGELRPIAILSFLSKVFEKLLHRQISYFINKHKLLTSGQSGFRAQRSCTTALLNVSEDIRSEIENNKINILVLLDHSKAFDTVDHDILITKLKYMFRFSKSAIKLVQSYLSNRYQSAFVMNTRSDPLLVTRGVPQGSILGPLLFTLYANDLPNQLQFCKMHLYADDAQMYLAGDINKLQETVRNINLDLQRVHKWACANGLSLNPSKSKCILIKKKSLKISLNVDIILNNERIEIVENAKNLGICFNSSLTWSTHIGNIIGSAYNKLRVLWNTQYYTPQKTRTLIVKSYIMPTILYGCELFSNTDANSKRKLNLLFNNITRISRLRLICL